MVSAHAVGVKDCARYSCAISRSRKCIAQSQDHATTVRNLKIAQILRLRRTYIYIYRATRNVSPGYRNVTKGLESCESPDKQPKIQ